MKGCITILAIALMSLWEDYEDINHGDTEARRERGCGESQKAGKPDLILSLLYALCASVVKFFTVPGFEGRC